MSASRPTVRWITFFACLLSFATRAYAACPLNPVVTNVNDSGTGSLRQAIADACTGDVITFNLGGSPQTITLTTGELSINKILRITGPGANLLTVSGGNVSRVFHIMSGQTVFLEDMTIANGLAAAGGFGNFGGAIYNQNGSLTIIGVTLRDNVASDGSTGAGGAIYNGANPGNASLTIYTSTLTGNTAYSDGGAILSSASAPGVTAMMTIADSTISGNVAGSSGGIRATRSSTGQALTTITNTTITNNRGTFDQFRNGGVSVGSGAIVLLQNSIVARNYTDFGTLAADVGGALDPTSASNLIGDGTGMSGIFNGSNGNQVGTSGSPIDPRLGPLADNGGPTLTHALLPGSPALDAGNNSLAPLGAAYDQRNNTNLPRIVDGPDADTVPVVDIGAFEAYPSIDDIPDQSTPEDTPLQVLFNIGTLGSPFESITATSSNPALVLNGPGHLDISGGGSSRLLTITPAQDMNSALAGTTTITVTIADSFTGTSMSDTFVLTVTPVDDPPTLDFIFNPPAILEDAGQQIVNLTGITAGPFEFQALAVTATSSNPSLIPDPAVLYGSPSNTGALLYTPVPDANGSAIITVTVTDGGLNTFVRTFTVSVIAVNDPPTLDPIPDPAAVLEDAGQQTVSLSGITAGGGETQNLIVTATSNNPSLIPNPAVTYVSPNAIGSLTYTPVADANGAAIITVTVIDDGSGTNTFSRTFTVNVTAVNDPPTLNAILDPAPILEDAGLQTVNLAGISAGGGETQSLSVTASSSNTALIPNPTVTYTSPNATGSLTYTPVADANGSAVITVTVTETSGGSLSVSRTFTVNVTAVNDPPTLDPIADPAVIRPTAGLQTINLTGISAGGGETQTLTVTATSNNTSVVPIPTLSYTSPSATGSLSYTPAGSGSAVITVTVTDNGGGTNTITRTFTVAVDAPPVITAIAPAAGPAGGGVPISIFGSGFSNGATVTVGGVSIGPMSMQVISATKIMVVAPPHAAGPADIVVTNPDAFSSTLSNGYTYLALPTNDNFANRYLLTGTGILPIQGSTIGASIETGEPSDAIGPPTESVWYQWTSPCGGDADPLAAVLGITSDFVVSVFSGSSLATLTELGSNVTSSGPAFVPASGTISITAGTTYYIRIRNRVGGTSGDFFAAALELCGGPSVITVVPNSGPAAGGTPVTIVGTDFLPGATVTIGGVAATGVNVVNPTILTAVTGAHAAGAGDVVVTNPLVDPGDLPGTLVNAFTYVADAATPTSTPPSTPPPTMQAPGAPAGLTSSVSGSTVGLFWNAPLSGGALDTYVVEAGTFTGASDAAVFSTGGSSTSLTVNGVATGTYFVRVRAQNAAGQSAASNEVIVTVVGGTTPSAPAPPAAPSGLVSTVSGSTVTLAWQSPAPALAAGAPLSYQVEAGSSPGLGDLASFSTGNAATSITLRSVPAGTYFVRVRAVNAAGMSGPSNEVTVIVAGSGSCTAPPNAPTGLRFTVSGSTVSLAWNASAGATTYIVSAGSSPGASDVTVADTGSAAPGAVAANVGRGTYFVRVSARNACGTSGASNEVAIVVQ